MNRLSSLTLFLVGMSLVFQTTLATGARRVPLTITNLKAGGQVSAATVIQGRINRPGRPVLLVRAKSGQSWWVQPTAVVNKKGYFKAPVRFGNEKTPDGCRFQVVAVLLQDVRALTVFKTGAALRRLPESMPQTKPIEVRFVRAKKLKKDAKKAKVAVVVRRPLKGHVNRVHSMTAELKQAGIPIVLVRSAVPNSPWWVQQHPKAQENGQYKITARFGNSKTKPGTKFKLVVLVLPRAPKTKVKVPAPGTVFKLIPNDVPQSSIINLTRQ